MTALFDVWKDFRDAARLFSPAARRFLLAEFLGWTGQGIFAVLFNLYLVEGGFQESFVGRAVAMNALGVALACLPAGVLADRWGRTRCLVLGALVDGSAQVIRCTVLLPQAVLAASFLAGAGQAMLAISAAPFITEHSTSRERTHLFSAYFATVLLSGVCGSLLGGWIPLGVRALPFAQGLATIVRYRSALLVGSGFLLAAALPLASILRVSESRSHAHEVRASRSQLRLLLPTAVNSILMGAGAGLVIPFMNLYFARRFACSSAQIGSFFSAAQIVTAIAALTGPSIARRFGKLRTAVASQLLSLPFLVTLGAESHLTIAVVAFLLRATLMQASTPLVNAFVMEVLPPELRARSTSLNNMVWNIGWALTSTFAGLLIEHFGYAVPFYCTAGFYTIAAASFYLGFRHVRDPGSREARARDAIGTGETAAG